LKSAEQVVLNNIANANTVGFKRCRTLFGDLPYRQVDLPGRTDGQDRPTTTGLAIGSGMAVIGTENDVSQGRMRPTKQPLDLAIQGEGYFQINDGHRSLYIRAGTFSVNANSEIVLTSKDRSRLLEPAIRIPIDATKVVVSHQGSLSVLEASQTEWQQIGQIQLARFVNPRGLVACGDGLFSSSTASGTPLIANPGEDGEGELRQGFLEESNVVLADELAELRRLQEQLKTLQQLHAEFGGTHRTR